MKNLFFPILCSILVTSVPLRAAESLDNSFSGQECLALDDAYGIAINNTFKGDNQQATTQLREVRHYLVCLAQELMERSTHPDASDCRHELEKRATDIAKSVAINYDLQIKNTFSGAELLALDSLLMQKCQQAIQENNRDLLRMLISFRSSLQKESMQVLLVSTNPEATLHKQEFFKRLVQATAFQRQLAKSR